MSKHRDLERRLLEALGLQGQSVLAIDMSFRPQEWPRIVVTTEVTEDQTDNLICVVKEYDLVPRYE